MMILRVGAAPGIRCASVPRAPAAFTTNALQMACQDLTGASLVRRPISTSRAMW
jgi:hypothetical protein